MTQLQFDFRGRAALVSGVGSAVGRAAALALGAAGASVVCGDINPDRADRVASEVVETGGRALAWQADVANRFQAAGMIEAGRDAFGRLDMLINATSVYKHGDMLKLDEWDWRRALDVNLTGTFFCTQLLSRVMAEDGGGTIINLASDAAYPNALPEGIAYATTNTGIIGMSVQAAHELASRHVRVNVVSLSMALDPEGAALAAAPLILFLCSEGAGAISGQVFKIGGV